MNLDSIKNKDYQSFSAEINSVLKNKMVNNEVLQNYLDRMEDIRNKMSLYNEIKNSSIPKEYNEEV